MALTVMVVDRRDNTRRRFSDVTFAFQVRLEVRSAPGLYPRANVTGYASSDLDAALADLHYRDVADYAVGCNTSAGWTQSTVTFRNRPSMVATQSSCEVPDHIGRSENPNFLRTVLNSEHFSGG